MHAAHNYWYAASPEDVGNLVTSIHIRCHQYSSTSETIRAGLRLLEERELKLATLQKALIEGEESGRADYSLKGLIAELDQESVN